MPRSDHSSYLIPTSAPTLSFLLTFRPNLFYLFRVFTYLYFPFYRHTNPLPYTFSFLVTLLTKYFHFFLSFQLPVFLYLSNSLGLSVFFLLSCLTISYQFTFSYCYMSNFAFYFLLSPSFQIFTLNLHRILPTCLCSHFFTTQLTYLQHFTHSFHQHNFHAIQSPILSFHLH